MNAMKKDISVNTLLVSNYELNKSDIDVATEFYHTELKWDSLCNYRSVQIEFAETPHLSVEEKRKKQMKKWYQTLITAIPSYLYFLTPGQFAEALDALSIPNKKYFVQSAEKVRLDQEIANYISESLVDLVTLNIAPFTLVETILSDLEKSRDTESAYD